MSTDQLVPYWDTVNQQFQGPGNVPGGSNEIFGVNQATGASATIPLGIATRAGKILDARIAAITPLTGNDTYTVDIRKNGVTVLSAAIAATNADTARQSKVGVLTVTSVAVGDFFEAVVTYSHGTGTAPLNVQIQLALVLN